MTAILDYCVPSRRRERHERKEQQALASLVNSRWGDAQITAPSEGGWNQLGSLGEQGRDQPGLHGSPQTSGSSVSTTPDLNLLYDKAIEAGISIDHRASIVQVPQPREERKNISFTITLPWPSRRANSPPMAPAPSSTSPPSRVGPQGTSSRPSTSHSTPPTAYMPASDRYIQPIMNPLAQSPPDRAVETFPVGTYTTMPGGFVQDTADVGLASVPVQYRGASPVERAAADPVARQRPTPPIQQHTSPIMRLEPIPATPYCVDNFADDPRLERPEAVMPTHPAVVTERAPRARSSSREPHSERYARMRSSSRGPSEDRTGVVRPSSRGPGADRTSTMRSSSRGPTEDRVGSTRSSSQGPAADRVPAPRSSSRDSAWDRAGTGGRSSSRGPAADRVGSERSSSRGPPLERSGRPRSASMGPPAGRMTTVRSASREPTAERLAYSRTPDRHDSFSSDSSSSTMFSDDMEEARARAKRKPRVPGNTAMPSVNPTGTGQMAFAPPSGGHSSTREGATTAVGGYYSSLASEYRLIAIDGERENQSQLQFHNESSDGSEGKDFRDKDKDYKRALKERLKETYSGGQALVPNSTDLYG